MRSSRRQNLQNYIFWCGITIHVVPDCNGVLVHTGGAPIWGEGGSQSSQTPVSAADGGFFKSIKHRDGRRAAGACCGKGGHVIAPVSPPLPGGGGTKQTAAPLCSRQPPKEQPGRADFFTWKQGTLPPEAGDSAAVPSGSLNFSCCSCAPADLWGSAATALTCPGALPDAVLRPSASLQPAMTRQTGSLASTGPLPHSCARLVWRGKRRRGLAAHYIGVGFQCCSRPLVGTIGELPARSSPLAASLRLQPWQCQPCPAHNWQERVETSPGCSHWPAQPAEALVLSSSLCMDQT